MDHKQKIWCVIFFILICLPILSYGGDETGGMGASYLRWGSGARSIALGQAYTALANQGDVIFRNPAGLSGMPENSAAFMHAVLFADRSLNSLEWSTQLPFIGIGVGWQGFGVDKIQERDDFGELIGHFDDKEQVFSLGVGRHLLTAGIVRLQAGISGKYFYHSLYNNKATGWGGDVGLLATVTMPGIIEHAAMGVAVQNIGATLSWDTESEYEADIPRTIRIGGAVKPAIIPLTAAIDLVKTGENSLETHTGVEYTWMLLSLRGGFNDGNWTAGAGLKFGLGIFDARIDYAVTSDEIADQLIHFISIGIPF